jgi:hypothetical protein
VLKPLVAKVRARRLGRHADVVLRPKNGDAMFDRGAPERGFPSLPGTAAIKTTGVDTRQHSYLKFTFPDARKTRTPPVLAIAFDKLAQTILMTLTYYSSQTSISPFCTWNISPWKMQVLWPSQRATMTWMYSLFEVRRSIVSFIFGLEMYVSQPSRDNNISGRTFKFTFRN